MKVAFASGDLPPNVNFAVKAAVVATFLDANRVAYKGGRAGRQGDGPADTADAARAMRVCGVPVSGFCRSSTLMVRRRVAPSRTRRSRASTDPRRSEASEPQSLRASRDDRRRRASTDKRSNLRAT